MPLELLKKLRNCDLPLAINNPQDIDKLRVLRAAGMVVAEISEERSGHEAVVHEITKHGFTALFKDEDPAN